MTLRTPNDSETSHVKCDERTGYSELLIVASEAAKKGKKQWMDHSGSGSKTASQWLEPGCVPGVSSGKNTGGGASSGGGAGGPVRLVFATNCYCKHSLLTQGQPARCQHRTQQQHNIGSRGGKEGQAPNKTTNKTSNTTPNSTATQHRTKKHPTQHQTQQQQQHNMVSQ